MIAKSLHWILVVATTLSFSPTSEAETGSSDDAQAYVNRAVDYYSRGDLTLAIRDLLKAQELAPSDPQVKFMLGNAFYRSGELDRAAEAYRTSLTLRPSYFEGH